MKIRKSFFIIQLLLMAMAMFAQETDVFPRYRPKHNEFIEMEKRFHIMGIRIKNLQDDLISIDVKFNKVLDTQTINPETITINNNPIDMEKLKYGKDGNGFRMFFEYNGEEISIKLIGILSDTGESLPPIIIEHGIPNAIYDFRSRTWQKF